MVSGGGGTRSGTAGAPSPSTTPRQDPDLTHLLATLAKLPDGERRELVRLVAVWPTLPPAVKAGIMAMVGTAGQETRQ